jgi:RimJ/RimL family protein N-acetyltransferase
MVPCHIIGDAVSPHLNGLAAFTQRSPFASPVPLLHRANRQQRILTNRGLGLDGEHHSIPHLLQVERPEIHHLSDANRHAAGIVVMVWIIGGMMTYYKKLVGKQCYLSPCSVEDAAKWAEWDNDLEVTIPLGDEAYLPISLDKEREMLAHDIEKQTHLFDIVALEGDALIGRCLLFNVDTTNRSAMLGIDIGEKAYWGKGFGQDALALLLDYGFNLLNLNNIMLGAFSYNERAIHCYLKVGFKEIGRRRQAKIIGGRTFDIVLMDVIAEEYVSVYVGRFIPAEGTV